MLRASSIVTRTALCAGNVDAAYNLSLLLLAAGRTEAARSIWRQHGFRADDHCGSSSVGAAQASWLEARLAQWYVFLYFGYMCSLARPHELTAHSSSAESCILLLCQAVGEASGRHCLRGAMGLRVRQSQVAANWAVWRSAALTWPPSPQLPSAKST